MLFLALKEPSVLSYIAEWGFNDLIDPLNVTIWLPPHRTQILLRNVLQSIIFSLGKNPLKQAVIPSDEFRFEGQQASITVENSEYNLPSIWTLCVMLCSDMYSISLHCSGESIDITQLHKDHYFDYLSLAPLGSFLFSCVPCCVWKLISAQSLIHTGLRRQVYFWKDKI